MRYYNPYCEKQGESDGFFFLFLFFFIGNTTEQSCFCSCFFTIPPLLFPTVQQNDSETLEDVKNKTMSVETKTLRCQDPTASQIFCAIPATCDKKGC